MARTVSVTITGEASGLVAAFGKGAAAAQAAAGRISKYVGDNDQNINKLSNTAGLFGAAAAAGVGVAVNAFADFDSAMSGVAATGADARASLSSLREAAITAGAETKYSATEAAQGVEELAKAGVSAEDTLAGGLTGALSLAAAGNLDVAQSAEAAASTMNQFGLAGKDVTQIADRYAQIAGVAQGNTSDVADAFTNAGTTAHQYGQDLDTTSQALAVLAKNGLVGAQAGTQLAGSFSKLYAPVGQGAKALKELEISAYDSAGAARPLGDVLDELREKTAGMTEGQRNATLAQIAGQESLKGLLPLVASGSAGLAEAGQEFLAYGSAADVAATKMDNLKGDLEGLQGSFETALIGLGEGGNGPLRDLAQDATDAINAFNDLGSGTKSAFLAVGAGVAAVALGAAGLGKVAIFANEAKLALAGLGITARAAGISMLGITAGLGIAAIAYSRYAESAAASKQSVADFTAALEGQTEAINTNSIAVANKKLEEAGALKAATDLGISLDTVTKASLGNAEAQAVVRDRLAQVKAAFDEQAAAGTGAADATGEQTAAYGILQEAVFGTSEEFAKAVESAKRLNDANAAAADTAAPDEYEAAADGISAIGESASDAAGQVDDLTAALFDTGNAAVALSDAQIGYEAAVDAAKAAVKGMTDAQIDSGKAGDVTTKLGQESQGVLNRLAGETQRYTQSLVDQGKGAKAAADATAAGRKQFIATAKDMGIGGKAARQMADDYGLIPKDIKIKVDTEAKQAKAEFDAVKASIKGLPKKTQAQIIAAYNKGGVAAAKKAIDDAAKKRDAKIEAKANGDAAVKRRLDEAAKNRKSQIQVNDVGTGAANAAINNAARNRSSTITVRRSVVTTERTEGGGRNLKGGPTLAFGGMVPGSSPHDRADDVLINATSGEFMQDRPAVRYWSPEFMEAVLARDLASVQAMVGAVQGKAYGGLVTGPSTRSIPTYANAGFSYAMANQAAANQRAIVQPQITQVFPASATPEAAAAAAGGWASDALVAIGAD